MNPKIRQRIEDIFIVTLLALLPVWGSALGALGVMCVFAALAMCMLLLKPNGESLKVTWLDISLVVWIVWLVLNVLFVRGGAVDSDLVTEWGAAVAIYVLLRQSRAELLVPIALVIGALVQMVIVCLQLFGILVSEHSYHQFTGSFPNPGPLGGYLAVAAICAAGLCLTAWRVNMRRDAALSAVALAIIAVGVVMSDSRAAWIAMFMGISLIAIRSFAGFATKAKRYCAYGVLLILGLCAVMLLYGYRVDSADGRLFIWQNSLDMVADRPIMGHGAGAFVERYMYYQADYFAQNPTSHYVNVADNVVDPFNELIRIVCEMGAIGGVLAIGICLIALRRGAIISPRKTILQGAMLGLLAFSMFSYPMSVLPLVLLFAAILASIGSESVAIIKWRPAYIMFAALVVVVVSVITAINQSRYSREYNQKYLRSYTKQLMQTVDCDSLAVLHRLSERIPQVEVYVELGDVYLRCGRMCMAKDCYTMAHRMVPSRVLPRYRLFKVYEESELRDSAIYFAKSILEGRPKISNTFTIRARNEAEAFLECIHQ